MEHIIEVSTSMLAQDVRDMEEVLTALKREMSEMDALLTLLNSMWQGDAKNIFVNQYTADKQTWEDMRVNVEEILKGMQNAKQAYERCESNVSQKIDGLRM